MVDYLGRLVYPLGIECFGGDSGQNTHYWSCNCLRVTDTPIISAAPVYLEVPNA